MNKKKKINKQPTSKQKTCIFLHNFISTSLQAKDSVQMFLRKKPLKLNHINQNAKSLLYLSTNWIPQLDYLIPSLTGGEEVLPVTLASRILSYLK